MSVELGLSYSGVWGLSLWVFENRVLRGVFGAKRDGVIREWRKLHNGKLSDLYCSPTIVRVIKLIRMGRGEVYRGFGVETEGKRLL
jgi:hypothetical protein